MAAPICAHGPSLPTEPPKARVRTVATSLTGATRQSIFPDRVWIAAMTASVPCPFAEGAKVRMSQTQAGSASGRRKYGRKAPGKTPSASRDDAPERPEEGPGPPADAQAGHRAQHRPLQRGDDERGVLGVPPALVRQAGRLGFGGRPHRLAPPGAAADGGGPRARRPGPQHGARGTDRRRGKAPQGRFHRGLDRPGPPHVDASTGRGEPEEGAATVPGVGPPREPAPPLQSSHDSRERARVEMEDVRELPGGDRRKPPSMRMTRRWGPVRPSVAAIRFDRRCRPWSIAQSSRMNSSVSPSGGRAPGPDAGLRPAAPGSRRSRRSTSAWVRT